MDIDRCPHRTVDCCDKGVSQYRSIKSELRLVKFLTGLNERYDWVKREILKEDPYPSVDEAYGWVKREAARLKIMSPASESPTTAVGSDSSSGVEFGFGAREYRQSQPQHRSQPPPPSQRPTTNRRGNIKPEKSKLGCSHCGMHKHTKETCFQLIGYPDWWEEEKAAKAKVAIGTEGGGKIRGGAGAEGSRETAQFQERRPETSGLQTGGGQRGDNGG